MRRQCCMTKLLSPSFSLTANYTPNAHSLLFIFHTVALKWLCHYQLGKKREIIKDFVRNYLNAHHIKVMISKHLNRSFFKRSSLVNGVTISRTPQNIFLH